jgi:hypothetical protein
MKRLAIPYTVTLVVLNATIGMIRLVEGPQRTQSIAYKYAKQVMPMRVWGVLFLTVAVLLLAAYRSTLWIRVVACAGLWLWLIWGMLVFYAALRDGRSSFVGPVLYLVPAIRHFQVLRRR